VAAGAFPFPAHPRTPYPPLIVNAALTGIVAQRARFPKVPLTAGEISADAQRCFEAGATIVHLHARDAGGHPRWQRAAYADLIPEIRRRCPEIVICVTTSGRAAAELDQRVDVLQLEGEARPDMASLTLGSLNFHSGPSVNSIETIEAIAREMGARGVRPELELFDLGMVHLAHRLLERGMIERPLYANLMLGFPNSAPADARSLVALVDALPSETVWAAAGLGAFQAPATALAIAIGGHVRTGLEDNPWLDADAAVEATNAQLVERVVAGAGLIGRAVATAQQTRALLGLPARTLAVPTPAR